ncbi:TPA: hypothetical protein ACGW3F_003130 [Bacillus paranthracis]
MKNTINESISLINQDIIWNIDDYLLPPLEKAQQQYEEDERQKKLEDKAWEKRYDKAKAEFNKRSEAMLDIPKPYLKLEDTKFNAIIGGGIWLLLCIMAPPPYQFFSTLLGYILVAFFIWLILHWVVAAPIIKILDIKTERRIEQTRKEIEEMKKREYPILFERRPSFGYWEAQDIHTKHVHELLKERYPAFGDIVNEYCTGGFSRTIDKLKEVRYLLNSGRAQTYEDATRMMWDYLDGKWEMESGITSGYFEEKERMKRQTREYQEERRREEAAQHQREHEEYARRESEELAWLKKEDQRRQQAFEDEQRRDIESWATHARQNGEDRATVKYYDDQLGRSYHERDAEDRKYDYRIDEGMSEVGGDLK